MCDGIFDILLPVFGFYWFIGFGFFALCIAFKFIIHNYEWRLAVNNVKWKMRNK